MSEHLKIFFLLFFAGFCGSIMYSQKISGFVADESTQERLAFVNFVYLPGGLGAVSDINGYFELKIPENTESIELSYLGYESKSIPVNFFEPGKEIILTLKSKPLEIKELVFSPKKNPADIVIEKVIENRKKNDPAELDAFSYISYEKTYFTFDSAVQKNDFNIISLRNPTKHHLFLLENLTQTRYKKPDLTEENIIASRASGFQNPSMVLLTTHLQSFSFYKDQVRLGSIKYHNPVSKEKDKYHFEMLDTVLTGADTIYVISFFPDYAPNSRCLKGFVHINSDSWAIQHIVAEAADIENENMNFKVQQKYEKVDSKHWFPQQYNVIVKFNENSDKEDNINVIGTTYITNVKINPDFKRSDFTKYNIHVETKAGEENDSLLSAYRTDTLNALELETYRILDSIGEKYYFESIFYGLETMFHGFFPVGAVDIDLSKIIDYNEYEGLRLGFGMQTNQKLSEYFRLSGYYAYGFKDEKNKYGATVSLFLDRHRSSGISFLYQSDLEEAGDIRFIENNMLSSSEFFRHFFVSSKVNFIKRQVTVFGEPVRYLQAQTFLYTLDIEEPQFYSYVINPANPEIGTQNFLFTDIGLRLRYAFGEEKILTPANHTFVRESKYPILWFNLERSLKIFDGQYDIMRLTTKIKFIFRPGILGRTHITIFSGIAENNPPMYKLFNGRGSYQAFGIDADNTFATMRINEFYSDKFVSFFHKQYFGSLRIFKWLNPEFTWNNNIGIGELQNRDLHTGTSFKTLEKGYYESGIVIDNLLKIPMFRYGFGVYYRYGPYAFNKINDNFAFNLSIKLAI